MAAVVCMAAACSAWAQLSPGPLSKVHSALNGPAHCTSCHDAAQNPPRFKCLECHREIRERLQVKRGLHPALVGADITGRSCARCHSDHNGENFEIIHWDTPVETFDHRRAGYTLDGRHAGVKCRECHQPAHIQGPARGALQGKDLARTYLGLSRECAGCHADEHRGQFTASCATCHDTTDWKKAASFDHGRARFSLTGAHEKVPCAKCHPTVPGPKPFARYRGVPFEDCSPCHNDPHRGAFRAACRSCHSSTSTWKPAQSAGLFNHSTTRYPLEGKHALVPCAACHRQANFKEPLSFEHCTDCHKTDPHHGQFADRPNGNDCSACHTVAGYKPSTFGVPEHAATRFPLRERHRETPCAKCHVAGAGGVAYRMQDITCAKCHTDVHAGQFRAAPYENRCEICHTESGFRPSTFTVARHSTGRFPLTGGHVTVACAKCHTQTPGSGAPQPARYRFEERTCTVCHADPHGGQFSARMNARLADGRAAGCEACHSTRLWRELQGFDHSNTKFPLEGAHQAVLCDQCHKSDNPVAGIKGIHYESAPVQCSGCHADVHGSQFSSGGVPAQCDSCHRVLKWKPSAFDHDTQSTYKLEGAHRTVACSQCHVMGTMANGARGIVYKSTPRLCSSCHKDAHAGQFADGSRPPECEKCHQSTAWKPSTFDHDAQSTYKLEGAHRIVRCGLCHRNTREVEGRIVIIYRPTPRDCSACHGSQRA